MYEELEAFETIVKVNPFAKVYLEKLTLLTTTEQKEELNYQIKQQIKRYQKFPEVKLLVRRTKNVQDQLEFMLESIPHFMLTLCDKLNTNSSFLIISRALMISYLSYRVRQEKGIHNFSSCFFKDISKDKTTEELNTIVANSEFEFSCFTKAVYTDFSSSGSVFPWKVSVESYEEMLEYIYIFTGLKQIFLKHYFFLLERAENQTVVDHIYFIFKNFSDKLNLQEEQFWLNREDDIELKTQMFNIIESDDIEYIHQNMTKKDFNYLYAFHPIINHADNRKLSLQTHRRHKVELDTLKSFTIPRLGSYLSLVQELTGSAQIGGLLSFIINSDPKKFRQLHLYFQTELENKRLIPIKLVASVEEIENNSKLKLAARKINSANINVYLEKRLEKILDNVRIEGALTNSNVSKYLKLFSTHASKIASEKEISPKSLKGIHQTTDLTLGELLTYGKLNYNEALDYRKGIHNEIQNMEQDSPSSRIKKLEQVALILAESSRMSLRKEIAENLENLYRETLERVIVINEREHSYAIKVEDFLKLPITFAEKIQLLTEFVPEQFEHAAISAVKYAHQRVHVNPASPVSIYSSEGELIKIKLIRLLAPDYELNNLMRKKIIPINNKQGKMTPEDFFSLPFGKENSLEKEDRYIQHYSYLGIMLEKKLLTLSQYEVFFRLLPKLVTHNYSRYFDIFPGNFFEESTFMAVYSLWENNGLDRIRIISDADKY